MGILLTLGPYWQSCHLLELRLVTEGERLEHPGVLYIGEYVDTHLDIYYMYIHMVEFG